MKILHISTTDSGGAANATRRIHEGLLKAGVDSKWLVLVKKSTNIEQVYPFFENENPINFTKKALVYGLNKISLMGRDDKYEVFSSPKSLFDITKHELYKKADLVNLHWAAYFIDYKKYFSKDKATVWRLSDMAPFTGGCHYTYDCDGFKNECHNCPQLKGTIGFNSASNNLNYKKSALKEFKNLTVVGVTDWVADEARKSSLFRNKNIVTVNNSIDTEIFYPREYNHKNEIKRLLIVADNFKRYNKGFDLLVESLNSLNSELNVELNIVGSGFTETNSINQKIINHGFVKDKNKLADLFSESDLTLIPSRYETFNQTTIESMACGTPVVAFDNSGPSRIINHNKTGYLAKAFDPIDFAKGIEEVLSVLDYEELRHNCIEEVSKKYTQQIQSENYIKLYKEILEE